MPQSLRAREQYRVLPSRSGPRAPSSWQACPSPRTWSPRAGPAAEHKMRGQGGRESGVRAGTGESGPAPGLPGTGLLHCTAMIDLVHACTKRGAPARAGCRASWRPSPPCSRSASWPPPPPPPRRTCGTGRDSEGGGRAACSRARRRADGCRAQAAKAAAGCTTTPQHHKHTAGTAGAACAHQGASTMCCRSRAAMKPSQSVARSMHESNSARARASMSVWGEQG